MGISKAEVQDIYVYDAEGSGRISFSSDDISEDYLAKVVFYDELNNALARHNFNFSQRMILNKIKNPLIWLFTVIQISKICSV